MYPFTIELAFDPDQPRDEAGRFGEGGGGGGSSGHSKSGSGVAWTRGGTQEKHFAQKKSLEGSKTKVKFRGKNVEVSVKNVKTAEEVGLRKSPVTHVADAFDANENHVGTIQRFPSGSWKLK